MVSVRGEIADGSLTNTGRSSGSYTDPAVNFSLCCEMAPT
jgi:hypothetical protein